MSIMNLLKQEFVGAIRLSFPVIVAFFVYPPLATNTLAQIACACVLGAYISYITYQITKQNENNLLYTPSGEHQKTIHKQIRACNIDPKSVSIKYAYVGEGTALSMFNTVVMDPTLCSTIKEDPEAVKIQNIFDSAIAPSLPEQQKMRLSKIKKILSPEAQSFIFKHELGHAFHNYSYKKILVNGGIAALATFTGISAGLLAMPVLGGIAASGIGILIGGLSDIALTWFSNLIFKTQEEKKADFFAARYSSCEEINAAADFFDKHQAIMKQNEAFPGLLNQLPVTVLSGHPDCGTRVAYLKKLASEKQA